MSKSPEKKSGKKSKSGGKRKKAERPDLDEGELRPPPLFACSQCGSPLNPDYVWAAESVGDHTDHVLVTHHCLCCGNNPDVYVTARYPTAGWGYAVAHLMKFSRDHVRFSLEGGWFYENPLPMYCISTQAPVLRAFRSDLKNVNTVDDFIRACGRGWPPGTEPMPA